MLSMYVYFQHTKGKTGLPLLNDKPSVRHVVHKNVVGGYNMIQFPLVIVVSGWACQESNLGH